MESSIDRKVLIYFIYYFEVIKETFRKDFEKKAGRTQKTPRRSGDFLKLLKSKDSLKTKNALK